MSQPLSAGPESSFSTHYPGDTMKLKPAALTVLLLLNAAGCGSVNLGQIDETEDPRDDMPGPGVLSNDNGESTLKWSVDDNQPSEEVKHSSLTNLDEKAEFEHFKKWNELRTRGVESDEYQEFLQWLKYQEFKAQQ